MFGTDPFPRRQGCPNWNRDATGAFTAAAWFGELFIVRETKPEVCLWGIALHAREWSISVARQFG